MILKIYFFEKSFNEIFDLNLRRENEEKKNREIFEYIILILNKFEGKISLTEILKLELPFLLQLLKQQKIEDDKAEQKRKAKGITNE